MLLSEERHEALRARYNPEGSPLREQQMRMLDIMSVVDTICRRHGLRYWLCSGTLIGALRHDGFIPWDDDLDIEMPLNDYRRFLEIAPQELGDDLVLQSIDTDPGYFFFFAKVRDRRSHLEENNGYDRGFQYQGIYIDVFPVEPQRRWIHKLSELTYGHVYKIWRTSTDDVRSMRVIRRYIWINRHMVHPLLRVLCRLTLSRCIRPALGIPFLNPHAPEDLYPLCDHVFEGRQFLVPRDADRQLRGIYGDYTEVPKTEDIHVHVSRLLLSAPSPSEK